MKRVLTIVVALLVAAVPALAQNQYGWTISSSSADPWVNTGAATGGFTQLYLWYFCSMGDGMSAMEAQLQSPAGVTIFGFTPLNGFLNAGTPTYLLLAVGGCPTGPVVAGNWLVGNLLAGDYCLVPSDATGTRAVVDCQPVPALWPLKHVGFGAGAPPSCDERINGELCVISVEDNSWGSVKSLYR